MLDFFASVHILRVLIASGFFFYPFCFGLSLSRCFSIDGGYYRKLIIMH